jgi:hypothetical protein
MKNFIRGLWGGKPTSDERFAPRMPEVDEPANLSAVFDTARAAASGVEPSPPNASGRFVVIVTPGRLLMFHPCPPAGSMPEAQAESMRRLIAPQPRRNIAAIANTTLELLKENPAKTIPFLGMLIGLAYIGHAVWIFEGHPSALEYGCREADVLLVDGGMVPYLQTDWQKVAAASMRRPEIYVHDRAAFQLSRVQLQQ